jgi:hypothetical protein
MVYFIPFDNCDNYIHSIASVSNSTMPILNFKFYILMFIFMFCWSNWRGSVVLGNLYVNCYIWLLLAFYILYVNHIHWYLLLTCLFI